MEADEAATIVLSATGSEEAARRAWEKAYAEAYDRLSRQNAA